MAEIMCILLKAHEVVHVHDLKGWTGTKDIELYAKAKADGFEVVITNDTKQLSRPLEVAAIAQSGLHRIEYGQNNKHGGQTSPKRSPGTTQGPDPLTGSGP